MMDYKSINKKAWDQRSRIHAKSQFYDLEGFKSGEQKLNQIEIDLIGHVAGKSMLHLQCHMGTESLGWQRLGADVTGVDLSEEAISIARSLAETSDLPAQFVCADLYDFGDGNAKQFDLVYTSYGVLCWLPDLTKWARVIANALKPNGEFYLVEFHPFYDVVLGYDYFNQGKAYHESESTYTENHQDEEQDIVTWSHNLSDVINALIGAGMTIEGFQEFDHSPYNCFEGMEENASGYFQKKVANKAIPVLYSVKAVKTRF